MILATKYIAGGLATLAVAVSAVSFGHHGPVCPDDFGTDDAGSVQYVASVNAWTNAYFDSHPDASMADWSEARHKFYIDNHCTVSLERYDEAKAGKADPETMNRVNAVIQETIGGQNH